VEREQEPRRLQSLPARYVSTCGCDMKEKRLFEKAEIKWPATIITSCEQINGETENISQLGVQIFCQELPLLGQECRLEIKPPNRQPLTTIVKVVWVTSTGSEKVSQRFRVGAEFRYISEDDTHFLSTVIANEQKEEN